MPEEEKKKKPSEIPVDIDTSGPEVDVDIEAKEEAVETAPETTEQETEVKEETRWRLARRNIYSLMVLAM